MKKLSLYAIVLCIALTGCGKKEEPAAAAATAPTMKSEKTVEKSMPTAKSTDSLVASSTATVTKAVTDATNAAVAQVPAIDFSKLTWDQVSNVPYAEKLQLASWAAGQADTWKGKLTEAAASQGLNMLSKMGDTGWQSSLKKVMDSVNAVRQSNPETYEMARSALVSTWGMFEKQASAFLAK
jgi:hypothetical protein